MSSLRALRPTLALWGLALAAKFLVGCSSEAHGTENAAPPSEQVESASSTQAGPTPISAQTPQAEPSVLISAVGDCTLGDPAGAERAPGSFHRAFDDGDMARPFSGVFEILSKDDLTIANLETTLTTAAPRSDLPFAFRGKPEFAQMLKLGSVELVSVANNHAQDCGTRGAKETREALTSAGVGFFGMDAIDTRMVNGIRVHNLGYLGGSLDFQKQMQKDVARLKKPDELVIVSFHWGIEEWNAVNDVQQKLGRAAIDAGADLVLGHHPHVLQGIETYRGKKIVYSLGNFVFGGNAQPDDIDSMIYQARFAKRDGKVIFLTDEIIGVAITGVRAQNDFRPVPYGPEDRARIIRKVDDFGALIPGQRPSPR